MTEPSLALVADRLRLLSDDVRSLREDMNVLTSIVLRQDSTMTSLLTEIRAVHSQISRMSDRIQRVDEKTST
jgi:hypothetical protein